MPTKATHPAHRTLNNQKSTTKNHWLNSSTNVMSWPKYYACCQKKNGQSLLRRCIHMLVMYWENPNP